MIPKTNKTLSQDYFSSTYKFDFAGGFRTILEKNLSDITKL